MGAALVRRILLVGSGGGVQMALRSKDRCGIRDIRKTCRRDFEGILSYKVEPTSQVGTACISCMMISKRYGDEIMRAVV